jgi:uncharacterized membrane protein
MKSRLPAALLAFALLTGCGSGEAPLAVVDPEAVPENPTFEQAFAIVQRECASCHRGGGGPSPSYLTCEDLVANRNDLVISALQENSMPPGAWPRLNSRDRLILSRWIAQGADAPCRD